MPFCLCQILAPGIKSVSPQQEPMSVSVVLEQLADILRQRGHILRVLDNRQPRAMLVSLDALESFQHLVTFDRESTWGCIDIGKYRTPDRMGVQNGACASFPHYTNVQRTLVRRLARMVAENI